LEAILNVRIKDLEIQLQLKDAKVEQLETAIQEKNLHGSQVHRNQEEPAFHGQIVKPYIKLIEKESDMENLEGILHVRIKELEIKRQLKNAEVEQFETAIQEKGLKRVRCY